MPHHVRLTGHRHNTTRFASPWYWALGIFLIEAVVWVAVGIVALVAVGCRTIARHLNR